MNHIHRQFQDGEVIAGTRYRVLGLLGVGGMGAVYDVEHTELGKRFVLKALHQNLAGRDELVARLRNEWRALGRLAHPNIVNVTDAGNAADGSAYYVMERLEGEPLSARMSRMGRHTIADAIAITEGILNALAAAHDIGVIHRDVKPPNVFVLKDGWIKLLDFGIAKVAESGIAPITLRGIAIGTPRYMAPEQARGDNVDTRADLYAVGLILFELLAGKGPFDGARDTNALLIAQLTQEPPALASLLADIPHELEVLVKSLLAKQAQFRPATAHEVLARLENISAAYVARARRPSLSALPGGVEALTPSSLQRMAESATLYQEVLPAPAPFDSRRPPATVPLSPLESFRPPGVGKAPESAPQTRSRSPRELKPTLGTLASSPSTPPHASTPPSMPPSTPPPLSSTLSLSAPRSRGRGWLLGAAIGTASAVAAFAAVMASGVLSTPAPAVALPAPPPATKPTPVAAASAPSKPEPSAESATQVPLVTPVVAPPALSATRPRAATAAPKRAVQPQKSPPAPASAPTQTAAKPTKTRTISESIRSEGAKPTRTRLPISGL